MLYLGCPQWSSNHWKGRVFTTHCKNSDMLAQYSQIFNTVEGNTSFYADPSPTAINNWYHSTGDDFRFTFKIPKRISHQMALEGVNSEIKAWLNLFEPLLPKIGSIMLQLPKSCSPEFVPRIASFFELWPKSIPLSIEVRHFGFFQKDDNEKHFNQLLMRHNVDRIIMDTRALFSEPANTDAIIDAQQKKPRVPVNVIATGQRPIIRFVGCSNLADNSAFYAPWIKKITDWQREGKTPYLFFHTADNHDSAHLARQFCLESKFNHAVTLPFPAEKEAKQADLF
ncbi:DUF72 domain-containing protein [Pseudoalteromonas sp. G4]|uniref:DUF72 domain-containing protein n=1 Tax=Pseudoalteromonas sp. G4 TaxID=2992761 RepID=UPI00237E3C64|nr:DUF72 domain-containing protein [Pseudoalteromonas sp. G4]MDE3273554.1 DUF72 domain-containing protein [Pseudoalteromonas sp. G4]